jgi:hypothetical protein
LKREPGDFGDLAEGDMALCVLFGDSPSEDLTSDICSIGNYCFEKVAPAY